MKQKMISTNYNTVIGVEYKSGNEMLEFFIKGRKWYWTFPFMGGKKLTSEVSARIARRLLYRLAPNMGWL